MFTPGENHLTVKNNLTEYSINIWCTWDNLLSRLRKVNFNKELVVISDCILDHSDFFTRNRKKKMIRNKH